MPQKKCNPIVNVQVPGPTHYTDLIHYNFNNLEEEHKKMKRVFLYSS